jgi:hypothetical protein
MLRPFQAVIVLFLLVSSALSAEQWPFRGATKFQKFTSADVAFEYPDDWRRTMVPPPVVALFTKGSELSFTVNRSDVDFPQAYNEAFEDYERKSVPGTYPGAANVSSKPIVHPTLGQILQIDFTQPGPTEAGRRPRPMRLRLYSVPVDRFVYRIVCLARADQFEKQHEPVFKRMMDSLVITPPTRKEGSR